MASMPHDIDEKGNTNTYSQNYNQPYVGNVYSFEVCKHGITADKFLIDRSMTYTDSVGIHTDIEDVFAMNRNSCERLHVMRAQCV